jgi:(p)ppGpp synthase/HD superfamily hydrolase
MKRFLTYTSKAMENKETFQARIQPYLAPSQQLDVKLAYCLAKFGHRAQTRKELTEGKPTRYFEHVRRVAIILMDEMHIHNCNMIIGALLHDSLEDTQDLSAELIEHCFGPNVAGMVRLLSKLPKEGYYDRLRNCKNWQIVALKMCDRLDNLRSLMVPGVSLEFQKRQIKETQEIYIPLFDGIVPICPSEYLANILSVKDEIRDLVIRYDTIIQLQENTV